VVEEVEEEVEEVVEEAEAVAKQAEAGEPETPALGNPAQHTLKTQQEAAELKTHQDAAHLQRESTTDPP
jgi:hypothetical protein